MLTAFPAIDPAWEQILQAQLQLFGTDFPPMLWQDNQTLSFMVADDQGQLAVATLDRQAGPVRVDSLGVSGAILSVAPNFSRVVMLDLAGDPSEDPRSGGLLGVDRIVSVVDVATGEVTPIARIPAGYQMGPPNWSNDGARVAFTTATYESVRPVGRRSARTWPIPRCRTRSATCRPRPTRSSSRANSWSTTSPGPNPCG